MSAKPEQCGWVLKVSRARTNETVIREIDGMDGARLRSAGANGVYSEMAGLGAALGLQAA